MTLEDLNSLDPLDKQRLFELMLKLAGSMDEKQEALFALVRESLGAARDRLS